MTGGAGFIGSHLVAKLSAEGYFPTVYDNLSTGDKNNLKGTANYVFHYGDITDFQHLKETMAGHDTVYHLAALPRITPSIADPLTAHHANLTGTLNVLEAARQVGVKHVIFAGSSSVFGKTASMPMHEDDPKTPNSPYAYQKWASEGYLSLYSTLYGLKTSVLRFFNVFGERMPKTGSYAVVAGIFLDQKDQGNPLTIKGDGEQRRDFTYVGDVVNALIATGDRGLEGTYHIGTGTNHSVNEIADAIDPEGTREHLPLGPGDYPETLADITKARMKLGYDPQTDIMDWLREQQVLTHSTLPTPQRVIYSP